MRLIDADALLEFIHNNFKAEWDYPSVEDVTEIITNAPAVQREGWVSVPIEPTRKMLDVYNEIDVWLNSQEGTAYKLNAIYEKAIGEPYYKAMLAAAPTETE